MIIYIHGFGGSANSKKASIFRKKFKEHNFIAPSLPTNPKLAIETLKDIIDSISKYEKVYLVGSSLGGYYALYLSSIYDIPIVLINPSVKPYITLQRSLNKSINFYDNTAFEFNESHLELLKKFEVKNIDYSKILLFLQKGDEDLDYKVALKKLEDSKTILEDGGNHSFVGIDRYTDDILNFFKLT